uniref:capsule polysaccharide transporter n=1 Tax=Paracoccus sp. TRP TaxID=412597 RepID=UPI000225F767|nr:capsule polysaccharide transporter [Paracoccus sp. TRP]
MTTSSPPAGDKTGQPAARQQASASPAPEAAAPAAPQTAAPAVAQRPFQQQQGLGAKAQPAQPAGPADAGQADASRAQPQVAQPQVAGPQVTGPQVTGPQPAAGKTNPPALRPQEQEARPIPVRPMQEPAPAAAAKPAAAAAKPATQPPAKAVARPVAKPAAKPVAKPVAPTPARAVPAQPVRPPVGIAQPRRRHWLMLGSFLALVVLPTLIWAAYLWLRASDQYVSTVGFTVRNEQAAPSIELLGGLSPLAGGGGAADTDVLYEYIRSQDMVERIDAELDLHARFSRAWPHDFVFAFNPENHIEDLTDYWQRQVKVLYDSSTQLITLKVSAFTPEDAQAIAAAVFQASSDKINEISTIARNDATRLARAELDKARAELTETRQAMTAFRMRSQIVDPEADLAGQMGVLSGLQAQLAEALVAHDLLLDNAQPTDHRVVQAQQKIEALRRLIEAERSKFGAEGQGPAGESYAQLMAEYEKLAVDREFAEGAYRSARIAYETALAETQRQARYLAAHIEPKVAQSATEPNRPWLLAMVAGLLLAGWSILVLIYYSVRDRR